MKDHRFPLPVSHARTPILFRPVTLALGIAMGVMAGVYFTLYFVNLYGTS